MTQAAGAPFYRRPSKERLAQGDIGFAEVVQVRSGSGSERKGPGPEEIADGDLPYLGTYTDHDLPVAKPGGDGEEHRILRVWSCLAIVVTQNCEVAWANPEDSRIALAPIVTQAQWPEGPWGHFRQAPPPGYLYLPPLDGEEARILGLPQPWPEAVVVLASSSGATGRIVKPRRLLSLTNEGLLRLQDALARFYGTRGFADLRAVTATIGKRISSIQETGQMVSGPSQLIKIFLGEGSAPDAEDEISVTYWGVRPGRNPGDPPSDGR